MGLAFFYTLFSYTEGCILNTTDHYQLNQWEGTDRILRTDFNKDNLKTDDAVAELRAELAAQIEAVQKAVDALTPKAGLQLIREGTLGGDSAEHDLALTDIDWNQWKAVYIEVEPYAEKSEGVVFTLNGSSNSGNMGSFKANTTPPESSGARKRALIILYPMFDENRCITARSVGVDDHAGVTVNTAFKSMFNLHIYTTFDAIVYGSSPYKIWGER